MASLREKKLYRSRDHRIIAGVCGGLAEWLGWDPTVVRVLFVVVSILSAAFPGILVYLVLWIVMPEEFEAIAEADAERVEPWRQPEPTVVPPRDVPPPP